MPDFQPQQEEAREPETNVSVPWQRRQEGANRGKDVADYNRDVDYNPEGSDPNIEAVNKEEENLDAEYAKMEIP